MFCFVRGAQLLFVFSRQSITIYKIFERADTSYGIRITIGSAHSLIFTTSLADGITNIYTYINCLN